MPSRRQLLRGVAALGLTSTVPAASARSPTPTADLDAALDAFGAGAVRGRIGPAALTRLDDAVETVAAESPTTAAAAADRLPSVPVDVAATDGLGRLETADLFVATDAPEPAAMEDDAARAAFEGVESLAVAVDFTARGPVLRGRAVGTEGPPSRSAVTDALAAAGLPADALEHVIAVADGDAVTLTAGFADRDTEQPFVLGLLLIVLAAVIGTFVLGLSGSASGGSSVREAPQVSFEFEASTDGGVTVTHQGGDNVESGRLTVRYTADGSSRTEEWTEPDGDVAAGDSYTTQARPDSGSPVRVVWTAEDGSSSATLGAFEMP